MQLQEQSLNIAKRSRNRFLQAFATHIIVNSPYTVTDRRLGASCNVTRGIYLCVPRPANRETSAVIRPSTAMATRDVSVTKTSHAADEFLATFANSRRPETGTASYKTIYTTTVAGGSII